jgi:long-chain acyl-CoA synthetase
VSEPTIAQVHAQLTAPGQPFEMEEVEIRGIATRTWKHAPPSLRAVLEASRAHGAADFLVYEDEHFSYERHFQLVARTATALAERCGVGKGDRVAIAMRNYPEWSVAFWAASAIGAVVVPLNAWWTATELAYGLRDSGSVAVVCDAERLDRIAEERDGLPDLRSVIAVRDDRPDLPGKAIRFDELIDGIAADTALPDIAIDPEDDATIFYTSGTTGDPKGVLGTQRNICTNLLSLGFATVRGAIRSGNAPGSGPGGPNVYLLSVPFFHATGCHSILVANLAAGNKIVLMHKWDPTRALELIEREHVNTFGGVPAMVWQVIEHPDFTSYDVSSLRSVGYGGAPAAPELVRKIAEMFPGRMPSNGYGLTETSSVTTLNAGVDYQQHPDSVGVPVPVCDVQVVDPDGTPLTTGEVGELWIKGPNVVKGYFNKPEATVESFSDGWLHSGDLARVDGEGFVYIVDRAKDLVIRGGENISSVEVEAALFEHPAVTDAAVIGVPHPVLGEEVGAVVHTAPGVSVSAEDLRAYVEGRIAGFKVPSHIWFLEQPLPRNAAGKILKRDLRAHAVDHGADDGGLLPPLPPAD